LNLSLEKKVHTLVWYDPSRKDLWDDTVRAARNGHFIFLRDFMDYHADRFRDASALLLRGYKIMALLPAHITGRQLVSHGGLSFGGWIQAPGCRHVDLAQGFFLLGEEMRRRGLERLVYSPAPYPYHDGACDDDLFLLRSLGATCSRIKLAAILTNRDFPKRRKIFAQPLRRAESRCPGVIEETREISPFWDRLSAFLAERHQAVPVHTAAEMELLKNRFPQNIRLFHFRQGTDILAGEVVFLSKNVLRFQYGFYYYNHSQDYLSFRLQEWIRLQPDFARPWVDLGTSMNPGTGELNQLLHQNKESFGARGIIMETWTWVP